MTIVREGSEPSPTYHSYYYNYDGLGSVSEILDSTGNVIEKYTYDIYGKVTIRNAQGAILTTSSIGNRYYFTGRELDEETGLYYYRARYYSPELGKFLTPDPIGYKAGLNLYTYCLNNPANWIDPFGLDTWIEGPSSGEPTGHQSYNVGDPNGKYDSYSFGVNDNINWEHGLEGEVYKDGKKGGGIDPKSYRKTTPEENSNIKTQLESEVGTKGSYSPWHTCRNYSQEKAKQFAKEGYGKNTTPPERSGTENNPSSSVPVSSSTVTSSEPYGPTSSSTACR